ncbi:hypothetical protein EJB05_36993 [Eragrostis curvula]|uniref:F-box domain-containing protein n=1 Tax=Eragrostis curvula TaxID=38414 RepID=A0A5J9U111_9POAL|nr:hypothetical protein EJB05_36993 [Eragrostis curvula]
MSPRKRGGKGKGSPSPMPGRDYLSALPDEVLHHVMSFLLAEEAVKTCVLARRWRHLWRSARSLRIVRHNADGPAAYFKVVREFVDHLLLLRGGLPLDTCDLTLSGVDADDISRLNLWIRHILMCKVRVLSLNILFSGNWVELDGLTLASGHLKKLQLFNLNFNDKLLDLSCCPALEILEIDQCNFNETDRISSQSLRCLSISSECHFPQNYRTPIYAPNLHSLRLEIGGLRTPMLEKMPSLVEAFVNTGYIDYDGCENTYSGDCEDEGCLNCYGIEGDTNNCVLLQGLSEARVLTLISHVETFIFRRDLKWCPIFGNLKTLLLDEYWCIPADFSALACMLEHSPILEKLTLQLFCKGPNGKIKMEGIPDPTGRSAAMSEHLKIVEVKCEVVDVRVLDVLKFLSKIGIFHISQHGENNVV